MNDWYEMFSYQGLGYAMTGSSVSADAESIENSFSGYINGIYKSNGIVFACMEARRSVFSEARFQFQRIRKGRPGDLFGSPALGLLEHPWPNCTTGELLSRAIQDVDLAGNHYVVREAGRLRRLRPDWVQIVLSEAPDRAVKSDVLGYVYYPGGIGNGTGQVYLPEEIAHWCPIPDPDAQYRGMSWITPILREIQADKEATDHKARFYANASTPKLAVSLKESVTKQQFMEFVEAFDTANSGPDNAYKNMYLGGGADVSVVGANMQQIDFKSVTGAGETRIAAVAGVPAVVVGFSEGMQGSSLNAGNYKAAKENFGDRTLRPLWRSVSAAYESLIKLPANDGTVRLWYDDRDIAFLRTDRKDQSEILSTNQSTIVGYVTAGFTPESSVAALAAGDETLLVHSGLVSVQLLPPGETGGDPSAPTPADGSAPPKGISVKPPAKAGDPAGKGKAPARALAFPWWAERHGSKSDPGYFVYHPGSAEKSGELVTDGNKVDKNDPLTYHRLPVDDEDQNEADEELFSNYSADGWSDPVSTYLRTGQSDEDEIFSNEEMDEMTAAMDRIAARHALASSVPLFRTAPASVYGDKPDGTVITDKAFTSTTVFQAITKKYEEPGNVTIRIDMPVGAHVIPHRHLNRNASAKGEVILPRNLPLRKVRTDGDVIVYEPVF
jgi:phage portal protein BeeE